MSRQRAPSRPWNDEGTANRSRTSNPETWLGLIDTILTQTAPAKGQRRHGGGPILSVVG